MKRKMRLILSAIALTVAGLSLAVAQNTSAPPSQEPGVTVKGLVDADAEGGDVARKPGQAPS